MKICAYVQTAYAKQNYKNECLDQRQFVGLKVIIDCLEREGYRVEYAGEATIHEYDIVLVSLTSDCDWWPFIKERMKWRKGDYKVIIGGASVLHVTPFTQWFDYAILGRGEKIIVPLVRGIENGDGYENESVIESRTFSPDRQYYIAQTECVYPHEIKINDKKTYKEEDIGCNHRCLFCGYTWQRKHLNVGADYKMRGGTTENMENRERAMLDLAADGYAIDWVHLRTTAIDGFSERLRKMVNKPITRDTLRTFIQKMVESEAKPHTLKLYNICGYPTETVEDWAEFIEDIRLADAKNKKSEKQWAIELHNTPFRAMPATPMACAPMSKQNYRGAISKTLGEGLRGNIIYQGNAIWSAESNWTDSLATVMLSVIAHRGGEQDAENIARLCSAPKFWRASTKEKETVLTHLFDMDTLFGAYEPETLPNRYLRTYAKIEKIWGNETWRTDKPH